MADVTTSAPPLLAPTPRDAGQVKQAALDHLWFPMQQWDDLAQDGGPIVIVGGKRGQASRHRREVVLRRRCWPGCSSTPVMAGTRLAKRFAEQALADSLRGRLLLRDAARDHPRRAGCVPGTRRPQPRDVHERRLGSDRDRAQGRLQVPCQQRPAGPQPVHRTEGLLPRHEPRGACDQHRRHRQPRRVRRDPPPTTSASRPSRSSTTASSTQPRRRSATRSARRRLPT